MTPDESNYASSKNRLSQVVSPMTPVPATHRFGIFHRIFGVSFLLIVGVVVVLSALSLRSHRRALENAMTAQADTMVNMLDQAAVIVLVPDAEGALAPVESAAGQCRRFLRHNTSVRYIAFTRNGGQTMLYAPSGLLSADFPKQETDVRILDGIWTPVNVATMIRGPHSVERIAHDGRSNRARAIHSDLVRMPVSHFSYAFDFEDERRGWIHVGFDMSQFESSMKWEYLTTAGVAGVALVAGLLVSFYLARSIARPVAAIRAYAEQVEAGHLSAEIDLKGGNEFGAIAQSLVSIKESLINSHRCNEAAILQESSLREKDVLLREIHHRVKNNMQILSSLLRLQRRRVDHALVRGALFDSELRIRSMALIHEKLYQSESLSSVEMGEYVDTLCRELLRMEGSRPRKLELDIKEISLGLDTALPCGLIINELVCNSMKYAFPDERDGTVRVALKHIQNTEYELVVSDDGVGMKVAPDLQNTKSLGLRLVGMLVEQLHGTVSFSNGVGTTASIRFRETEYRKRV